MRGLMVARLRHIVTGAEIGNLKPCTVYIRNDLKKATRLILAFKKIQ